MNTGMNTEMGRENISEDIVAKWSSREKLASFYDSVLSRFGLWSSDSTYIQSPGRGEKGLGVFIGLMGVGGKSSIEVHNDEVKINGDINGYSVFWRGENSSFGDKDFLVFSPKYVNIEHEGSVWRDVPLETYLTLSLKGMGYEVEEPSVTFSRENAHYFIMGLLPTGVVDEAGEKTDDIQSWLKSEYISLITEKLKQGNKCNYVYNEESESHQLQISDEVMEWYLDGNGQWVITRNLCSEGYIPVENISYDEAILTYWRLYGESGDYERQELNYSDYQKMMGELIKDGGMLGYRVERANGLTDAGFSTLFSLVHDFPLGINVECRDNHHGYVSTGWEFVNLVKESPMYREYTKEDRGIEVIEKLLTENFSQSVQEGRKGGNFVFSANSAGYHIKCETALGTKISYGCSEDKSYYVTVEIPSSQADKEDHRKLEDIVESREPSEYNRHYEGSGAEVSHSEFKVEVENSAKFFSYLGKTGGGKYGFQRGHSRGSELE